MSTLRSRLVRDPHPLAFGTSGRRGLIADLSQLEVCINVTAELEYLLSLPHERGGILPGDEFFYALDLRPSSRQLAAAVSYAIGNAGLRPVNLGFIPTPALMHYAMSQRCGSIMVTGSHIPFDRNGYKLNTSRGELRKEEEAPINAKVAEVRARFYEHPFDYSPFDENGDLRVAVADAPVSDAAREAYVNRYLSFFPPSLAGRLILVYQHSAVGRDLVAEVLTTLGADVIPAGRSNDFVPIDTENIDAEQLSAIRALAAAHGNPQIVISTDGDSDRPLILAADSSGELRFFGGDLVGMVVARYLNADAVVVPVSCNDAIDRGDLSQVLEPKTRIGSPFVIVGMAAAIARGRRRVCGWEANGGFLLGSDIEQIGKTLKALPTRDALLPILGVLFAAESRSVSVAQLFEELPRRFSRSGLLKNFPREVGLRIARDAADALDLSTVFTASLGFGASVAIDRTDGLRITFSNGDVAHIRPSGNADELRIYATADTQARADAIVAAGIAEPAGILRTLETLIGR